MNDVLAVGLMGAICLGMVGLIVGVIVFRVRGNQRRRQEYLQWCSQNGYQYLGEDETVRQLSTGYPFESSIWTRGWPIFVMRGSHRGHHAIIFEWIMKVGRGMVRHEVIALSLPQPSSYLDISRKRGVGDYLMSGPGTAPSGRDFNEAFQVTTAHPGQQHQVRSSGIPALLSRTDREDPFIFRIEGQWAIAVRLGEIHLPSVGRRLDLLHRFVAALPGHRAASW